LIITNLVLKYQISKEVVTLSEKICFSLSELHYAANFSVPGSGKTTMILASYALLKKDKKVDKLLVIGPYSSFGPWEEETKNCFSEIPKILRLDGDPEEREGKYYQVDQFEILLISYHMVLRDIEKLIDIVIKNKFMIVIDESHHIKSISGKISNSVLRLSTLAYSKAICTGTPIPNDIKDIFSQFTFLYPEVLLGSKARFKHMIRSSEYYEDMIKEKIEPFFTRITKVDLDLPPPKTEHKKISMSKIQQTLYHLVSERYDNLLDSQKVYRDLDQITAYKRCKFIRLRQIASNINLLTKKSWKYNIESIKRDISEDPVPQTDESILEVLNDLEKYPLYESSPKIRSVINLVEDLRNRGIKKILIWSDFILNLETLYNFFKEKYSEEKMFF
jgi:SNF2 family DNA or RNA helicase